MEHFCCMVIVTVKRLLGWGEIIFILTKNNRRALTLFMSMSIT